jgi:hypothetical protein
LTPREHNSGELSYQGRISKMGDRDVRRLLYVAASRMLRRGAALWCPLKAWAVRLAQRVGLGKARVALARKLAVVLHAMWSDGQVFRRHHPGLLRAPAVPIRETAVRVSREGGTGWDASEATRLVRAASPCDADYEDGSVPLQLPLSCADRCVEARREGCHLREIA